MTVEKTVPCQGDGCDQPATVAHIRPNKPVDYYCLACIPKAAALTKEDS